MHIFDTWIELFFRVICVAILLILLVAAVIYIALGSSFFELIPARIAGWFLLTCAAIFALFLALAVLKAILAFLLGPLWPNTPTWCGTVLAIALFAVGVLVVVNIFMGGDVEEWKQGISTAIEEMLAFLNA